MELSTDEIKALVWIALAGGERAIERDYAKYDSLEERGLTEIIHYGNAYTISQKDQRVFFSPSTRSYAA